MRHLGAMTPFRWATMTAGAAMKSTVYFKKSQRAVAIVLPGADDQVGAVVL